MNDSTKQPTDASPQGSPQAVEKFEHTVIVRCIKNVDGSFDTYQAFREFVAELGASAMQYEVKAADGNYVSGAWSYFSIHTTDPQERRSLTSVQVGDWLAEIAGRFVVLDDTTVDLIRRGMA